MAETHVRLEIRLDRDMDTLPRRMDALIQDAYARGTISWARRCEMLADLNALMTFDMYDVPTDDEGCMRIGRYGEPSEAFIQEIGTDAPPWPRR
ncbi:hypothetical protein [Methylobacterium sp. J-068]|uniref:hypothetical protein n=1 Tax=Methylobacterium sp. J-068 TaxID=2836649 RepID=UPI001FBB723A|nr:hypothetical protein [Methylobacterium sp. J-068]MCJ2036401.1 hypothetical protein [Methylobacterium sp. J-068]